MSCVLSLSPFDYPYYPILHFLVLLSFSFFFLFSIKKLLDIHERRIQDICTDDTYVGLERIEFRSENTLLSYVLLFYCCYAELFPVLSIVYNVYIT